MIIVVNHLTRMRAGHFCVGGVEYGTRRHVRPVLEHRSLTTDILSRRPNPFDMANIVELGRTRPNPENPHVEDHVFELSRVRLQGPLPSDEFWHILNDLSNAKLRGIFGAELRCLGRSRYGTDEGEGQASLGCLRLRRRPSLRIAPGRSGGSQIRMMMSDGEIEADASVTDIRLYGDDRITPDERRVKQVAAAMRTSQCVILSVGLTRAFASSDEYPPIHWLQVNNIHLQENPAWQLG